MRFEFTALDRLGVISYLSLPHYVGQGCLAASDAVSFGVGVGVGLRDIKKGASAPFFASHLKFDSFCNQACIRLFASSVHPFVTFSDYQ